MLWLLLKIYFTKAPSFNTPTLLPDNTLFEGFLTTYNGWNCNYTEFTYIPLIYLLTVIFCYWFINKILQIALTDPQVST